MHDVTLVYTEYNHRLEVWVLGKRAANTTADRQQYTNTSKVCDDTMSMLHIVILTCLVNLKFWKFYAVYKYKSVSFSVHMSQVPCKIVKP